MQHDVRVETVEEGDSDVTGYCDELLGLNLGNDEEDAKMMDEEVFATDFDTGEEEGTTHTELVTVATSNYPGYAQGSETLFDPAAPAA